MLAVTGSLKFNPLRKPKTSLYPKGVSMSNSVKKGLIAVGVLAVASVQNASAALTAADIPMTTATADVTLVFLAILGVSIVLYGFRKILGLTGK